MIANMDSFPDPDDVGQTEYLLVYDHVDSLIHQGFDYTEVMDSLYELEEQVSFALVNLKMGKI